VRLCSVSIEMYHIEQNAEVIRLGLFQDRNKWRVLVVNLGNPLHETAVAGIRRMSAVDTVRTRIAIAIELGLLKPAERLPSDDEIATSLNVSTITARRALVQLQREGLVQRRRGQAGGSFVADKPAPVAGDVSEHYRADKITVDKLIDQRTLIETALVTSAALNPQKTALLQLQTHIDEAARATSWADYHLADEKFHLALVEASGLKWAEPQHREVLTSLYKYFVPYPIEYLRASNEEHQKMLDAINAGDVRVAVTVCHAHIQELHESMYTGLKA